VNHDTLDPVISIGTLAEKVGLSVSSIRKYEDAGLLISHRKDSQHRLFCYEDITRINTIQYLIKELGINIEGIRRIQAMLPCWNMFKCHKSNGNDCSKSCSAHTENSKPCWMIKDAHCTLQGNECRKCVVYRFGSLCTENIKDILHTDKSNQKEVMRNFLEQKLNKDSM